MIPWTKVSHNSILMDCFGEQSKFLTFVRFDFFPDFQDRRVKIYIFSEYNVRDKIIANNALK